MRPDRAGLAAALEARVRKRSSSGFRRDKTAGKLRALICIPARMVMWRLFHSAPPASDGRCTLSVARVSRFLCGGCRCGVPPSARGRTQRVRASRRLLRLPIPSNSPALGGSACTVAPARQLPIRERCGSSARGGFGLRRRHLAVRVAYHASNLRRAGLAGCARYLAPRLRAFLHQRTEDAAQVIYSVLRAARLPVPVRIRNPIYDVHRDVRAYRPEAFRAAGSCSAWKSRGRRIRIEAMGWGNVFAGG